LRKDRFRQAFFGFVPGGEGINDNIYNYVNNVVTRKSLAEAKKLLAEAGYPNGRDEKTGKPLVLNYDVPSASGPDDKARFDWMRKQFTKLGIQLNIRSTQYNRFQEKMRKGNAQLFSWGWLADYPDPENFLFLLYGPNGKVKYGGENAANYQNPEFDKLFNEMKNLPNGPERQAVINKMIKIVRWDTPWVWGFHPQDFVLSHRWVKKREPNAMANNTLKYQRIDPVLRSHLRSKWNSPVVWPILVLLIGLFIFLIPVFFSYWWREHRTSIKRMSDK